MQHSRRQWYLHLGGFAALALLMAAAAIGQAPATRVGTGQDPEPLGKLDWDREGRDEYRVFEALRKGEQAVADDTKPVLDNGAKWFAYRLTLAQYQEPPPGGKSMHKLVEEAKAQIIDPRDQRRQPNGNQLVFMEEFGKRLTARLDDVLRNRKEIARVNAARILAHLAATGLEEAADPLVKAIADPGETDAVRLYAFRGLRDLFQPGVVENTSIFKNKEREARAAQALVDYLNRKPALRSDAGPQEIAAVNFVRSQAALALGQTRYPAVAKLVNKQTTLERPTALTLLRVVRNDGVPIRPSLQEQVDAAVAVCLLKHRLCEEYHPDYVAQQVARFVVEFGNRFNARGETIQEPWKTHAVRLYQALSELQADTARHEEGKWIAKLTSQAQSLLVAIINSQGGSKVTPTDLTAYLDANRPKNSTVYKGLPNSRIRAEEATGG